MLQPMDAIVDSREGDGTYYYVYERGNRRVQSFSLPQVLKDQGPFYGAEEILESRGIYNGTTTGVVSTSASIAKWGINMCMYTCPKVEQFYEGLRNAKQEKIVPVTQVFLLCHNEEEPENSHIKQFEAKEMKKMRDWKLPKEIKQKGLRFCKWGGVTMCLGDPYRPEARLCTVAMLETTDGHYKAKWYLIRWRVADNEMYGKPKLLELKWLDKSKSGETPIVDDVKIGYMTSWGDQLYISDVGRRQLYLTDLEGNLRRQIGSENLQPSKKHDLFGRPGSITVDAHGNFLVADETNNQIKIFTKTGDFLGLLMHNFVSSPCGLELLDDGRLIYFSKETSTIYVTKLGPEYEDLEFKREESEGSKRFFNTKYASQRGGRGRPGRGRGGGRGRRGVSPGYSRFVPGGNLQGTARDVTSSFSTVNNPRSNQVSASSILVDNATSEIQPSRIESFVAGSSVFNEPVFESDSHKSADVETASNSSSKFLPGRVTNPKV